MRPRFDSLYHSLLWCVFASFYALPGGATAQVITEFSAGITPGPGGVSAGPGGITAGPDDNVWFVENVGSRIARITPSGVVTEFSIGAPGVVAPVSITMGADGNLWFTEFAANRIGRITPLGVVSEFSSGITVGSGPLGIAGLYGIATGADGNVWFTEGYEPRIGRITPSGAITEFSTGITTPTGAIAAGPDGNLWFTEAGDNIGRITPLGVVTEFVAGITPGSGPAQIAAGPDGNVWFTEVAGNRIGRITPTGVVTEFGTGITVGPRPGDVTAGPSGPTGISAGPDGNLWFLEGANNRIGRITPLGIIAEFTNGVTDDADLGFIATGPDGNVWFTEALGNRVGRIAIGAGPPTTLINYEGLWWNAPAGSESGWGINFAHQGDVIFATWFTYDLTGKAWWLSMTANQTASNTFSGALIETNGPAYDAAQFNPSAVTAKQVGTATLTFNDANSGTFAYTVNGVTQSKLITRQVFGTQPNLALATNYQDGIVKKFGT